MEGLKGLKVGEKILLTGKIYTARDEAHKYLLENEIDFDLDVIYHCGPLIKDGKVVSAGPTTSARMNAIEREVIEKYEVSAVVGKGGMDPEVFKESGAVYLAVTGGCGALIAKSIKSCKKVVDLGPVESIYELEVEDLPVVVAIDAEGERLFK